MAKRPTPKMLGSGMAQRTAAGLKSRKSRLDAAIDSASGRQSPARGRKDKKR